MGEGFCSQGSGLSEDKRDLYRQDVSRTESASPRLANLDRLTRTTYPDTKTVQAASDRASNRTSLTNPGGTTTTATYDAGNP